jgi:hypothetical protein
VVDAAVPTLNVRVRGQALVSEAAEGVSLNHMLNNMKAGDPAFLR